jgi:hypothetical protein
MRMHAPLPGKRARAGQGSAVNEPPKQKAVFRSREIALARGKTRKLP